MRHTTVCSTFYPVLRGLMYLALGTLAAAALAAPAGLERGRSRNLVLSVGRSSVLHFDRMKRVEVLEPTLVDVVVASLHDLSVYGKKEGLTTIFVWDRVGAHQIEVSVLGSMPAEKAAEDLRRVLGNKFTYTVSGDRVVVVEGTVSAEAAERAHRVLQAATSDKLQIVDLVKSEDALEGQATLAAKALRQVLGENLEYVVWNPKTLLVRGAIGDKTEVDRARKVLEAAKSPDLMVVDLLEYEEPQARPPVDEIAQAVGEKFQVWRVQGRTVAVGGTVPSKAELENLNKLLQAFEGVANVVNLVQVVEPKPTINDALTVLQAALGNKLTVRPMGNQALIVEGTVANEKELTNLRGVLGQIKLDYQVVDMMRIALQDKKQVLVHARIMDVNRGALKRLGVNYGQLGRTQDGGIAFSDQPWLMLIEGDLDNVYELGAQVDYLASKNLAKILSEPNVLVDDGGKAMIHAGGEIPIPVSQSGGGVYSVTVEWRPYGVRLQIEPGILEDGKKINLKVVPEVSSLDFSNAVTIGGFVLPALKTRRADTVVTIENGRTLVIGGLLNKEDAQTVRKLPLISEIPIIGELFKRKEFTNGSSELVIMITPEIVQPKTEAQPQQP